MKNKKILSMVFISLITILVFGSVYFSPTTQPVLATSGLADSQENINLSNSNLRALINQLIEVVRQLIVQLSKQSNSTISTDKVNSNPSNTTNTLDTPTVVTEERQFCPTVMCAAPPLGMCYKKENSTDCGCGVLTTECGEETEKIICPTYMCAAPPLGMCYKPDPNNSCSCGILTTSCSEIDG